MKDLQNTVDIAKKIFNAAEYEQSSSYDSVVMGEVGAGKSTFINNATGQSSTKVGHDLDPCTTTVQHIVVKKGGRNVAFVDTPGFNHPSIPDGLILKKIIDKLKNSPLRDMQFGGVIYLYDLSQPRDVSRGKNIMTPMKLSTSKIGRLVILATVDGNGLTAKHREKQLKLTDLQKVEIQQFTNTKDSAWNIVDAILRNESNDLPHIQELDKICESLPKQFPPKRQGFSRFFFSIFGLM